MPALSTSSIAAETSTRAKVVVAQLATGSPSAFVRWHLSGKFAGMERLFSTYLKPGARFVDIGCGTGDALVLAQACEAGCELWGLDIDVKSVETAQSRVPTARVLVGDMHDPDQLPRGYFDIVHEFGAAFLARDWTTLVQVYFSLLRDGGILLWELPERWSFAHLSYLLRPAPKASDNIIGRLVRSLSPHKYHFESRQQLDKALKNTGCEYEILEGVPLWHFFCRGFMSRVLDRASRFYGDHFFDVLNRYTAAVWPPCAGYYLVIRKMSSSMGNSSAGSSAA